MDALGFGKLVEPQWRVTSTPMRLGHGTTDFVQELWSQYLSRALAHSIRGSDGVAWVYLPRSHVIAVLSFLVSSQTLLLSIFLQYGPVESVRILSQKGSALSESDCLALIRLDTPLTFTPHWLRQSSSST